MTEDAAEYRVTMKPPESALRTLSGRIISGRWRCHDGQCRARQSCELWLTRNNGDPFALHTASLRECWIQPGEPCGAYTGPPRPEDDT